MTSSQTKSDMFDFHTHILPKMDDGSSSVEESIAMLHALKLQGVNYVAATPHFYADRMSPNSFFERRQAAWDRLKPHLSPELPEIRLGAEIQYFEGINRYEGLERFCIDGTDLLLLEMPMGSWTTRMVSALAEINARPNITVLLAHIERYYREQSKATWDNLLKCGIQMQASASFFISRSSRRLSMKLLRDGSIHVLGTDCHDSADRKPDMADAVTVIERKKGSDLLQRIDQRAHMYLQFHTGQRND